MPEKIMKVCRGNPFNPSEMHQDISFLGDRGAEDCPMCRSIRQANRLETDVILLRSENLKLKEYSAKVAGGDH